MNGEGFEKKEEVNLQIAKEPPKGILEDNLKALKIRYPSYAQMLEKVEVRKRYLPVIVNNKLNVFDTVNNFFYYNIADHNSQIKNEFEELKLRNAKIALFLGFGFGYEVQYYANNIAEEQKTQYFIVVEKDLELFKLALSYLNYVPMFSDNKILLLLGMDDNQIFNTIEGLFKRNITLCLYLKCIKPVYLSSALKIHNDYYVNFLRVFRETVIYLLEYFGNSPDDSFVGIENILENIDVIIKNPGINMLYNKFKGKPAVIVSTGPSLNKNKHLLKEVQDRALIICPDASLPILLELGVKPQMITSLERVQATVELVSGYTLEQVHDVYYAGTPVIKKEAFEAYPGPKIVVYRNFDHFKWIGVERGILDIKHSSGNMAFKIADALGCDPIILIGQDLAYGDDGKTHASNALLGDVQGENKDKFYVKGNNGGEVLTYKAWDTFRKAYESDLAEYKGRCINSTEGGAFIYGTTVIPFREAIDKYIGEKFYPLEIIKETLSKFSDDSIDEDISKIQSVITKTLDDLKIMMEDCLKGIETIKKVEVELNEILNKPASESREDKILDENFKPIMDIKQGLVQGSITMQLFLMHIIQPYLIKFEIEVNEFYEKYEYSHARALILLRHLRWFAIIHDIMRMSVKLLKETQDKISKLDESTSSETVLCEI